MESQRLDTNPIHLGLGASSVPQPAFTGDPAWYGGYATRHGDDGAEGRLVAMHSFSESWDSWEMHPVGSEVVLCTVGEIELVQQFDDGERMTTLRAGEYAINPAGVWHTANADRPCTVVFITAGAGTEHRPR